MQFSKASVTPYKAEVITAIRCCGRCDCTISAIACSEVASRKAEPPNFCTNQGLLFEFLSDIIIEQLRKT